MNNYYTTRPCLNNFFRQMPTESQMMCPSGNSMQQYPISQTMPTYPLAPIGTTLPTGMPAGANLGPPPAIPDIANLPGEISPITTQNILYVPGYLKSQIGRRIRVEFLIGTTGTTDRAGTLLGVGASYILIRLDDSDDVMLCDLYSIKFVTFFY